jgi:hypothetical protein
VGPRSFGGGLLLLGLTLAVAGTIVGARLLGWPEAAAAGPADPVAGLRAQHGLAELLLRGGGLSRRQDPIELTTVELNALLARHIRSRRLALEPLVVRAGEGTLEIAGRTSLREIGPASGLGWLVRWFPAALSDLDFWVVAQGHLEVRAGEAEFVVRRTAVGRQRVPAAWLWSLIGIDPQEQLLWRMPRIVERLEVRRDRLLIHTRRAAG